MNYLSDQNIEPAKLLVTTIGTMLGIGILSFLSMEYNAPVLVASFGATAVLIYGIPESPLARPKNVFFGHMISAFVGVACSMILGCSWYSMAIAVTIAIILMTITGTLHPPGGATALICVMYSASLSFILSPILVGVITMMMMIGSFVKRSYGCIDSKKKAEGLSGT